MAALAMKLQIVAQDYADQLENAMVEAVTVMPRVVDEIERVEASVKSLQTSIAQLSNHIEGLESRRVTGVDDLSRLDILKRNMELCKVTLTEAARWAQHVRDARAALASHSNIKVAADKIEAMQQSLNMLKDMPDHNLREQTLREITDTLAARLHPKLVQEINAKDPTLLQELIYVFRKINKAAEVQSQYIETRPVQILQLWYPAGSAISEWLPTFYNEFLALLSEESSKVGSVFGISYAPTLLCQLSSYVLDGKVNEMAKLLAEDIRSEEQLLRCLNATVQFLIALSKQLVHASFSEASAVIVSGLQPYVLAHQVFVTTETKHNVNCRI
jgi:acetolactate synthase small subunit